MPPRPALVGLLGFALGSLRCVVRGACLDPPDGARHFEDEEEGPTGGRAAAAADGTTGGVTLAAGRLGRGARRAASRGLLARLGVGGGGGPKEVAASPGGVTASPDVQVHNAEEQPAKRWALESPEGGSDKSTKWRAKKGGGTGPWIGAVLFICMIGCMPMITAFSARKLTVTQVCESVLLYVWLLGGVYLFTNVIIFQSPHFEHPRTLSVEETAYLYAQILTTVGYGDITPARPRGQLSVGLFVLTAVLLIASMVQDMLDFFRDKMDGAIQASDSDEIPKTPRSAKQALRAAFLPVIYSSTVFCCFLVGGAAFFVLYPGEEKTLAQAVYMSLITLSTIGFGAFTPSTHAGMVVGAYWMLFGCASLMAVVTSRAAFSLAMKDQEILVMERKQAEVKKASRVRARMYIFTKAIRKRSKEMKSPHSGSWPASTDIDR